MFAIDIVSIFYFHIKCKLQPWFADHLLKIASRQSTIKGFKNLWFRSSVSEHVHLESLLLITLTFSPSPAGWAVDTSWCNSIFSLFKWFASFWRWLGGGMLYYTHIMSTNQLSTMLHLLHVQARNNYLCVICGLVQILFISQVICGGVNMKILPLNRAPSISWIVERVRKLKFALFPLELELICKFKDQKSFWKKRSHLKIPWRKMWQKWFALKAAKNPFLGTIFNILIKK